MSDGPIVFDGSVLARGPITGVGRSFLTTLRAYLPLRDRACILALADDAPPPLPGIEVVRIAGGTGSRCAGRCGTRQRSSCRRRRRATICCAATARAAHRSSA